MKLVLDASMALAWIFERQKTDEIECANRALQELANMDTLVPALWHIEISNALLVGERRSIVTEAQVLNYLSTLSDLPIVTDNELISTRRDGVMSLARQHKLSAYDAVYLDLALRHHAVLATFDGKLSTAMQDAGGSVFGK
ncbi:MAG: type II toxin-antitoxin system VapC family toxin [Gammaproteobacteria bacterium]|nr:type II toxin-antitoxin system VapC family toxin [Gammaproteobacteria bacterium]